MHLKVIISQQRSVEKSHIVLKLILNSDHGLALFRQKQILKGLLVTKNLQKSEVFFIQLLYAWLHLSNNNFPAFISIEKILILRFYQPIFLYFYTNTPKWTISTPPPPRNIEDKFTIVSDLCRFLQYKIYKFIMSSIPNDWKHLELEQQ